MMQQYFLSFVYMYSAICLKEKEMIFTPDCCVYLIQWFIYEFTTFFI